jgi:osmotically-inducible protein OsmY
MKTLFKIALSLGLIQALASCAPVAAVSSAVVGTTIADERSAGDSMDDAVITLKIKEDFVQKEFNEMLGRIGVTSHEGRVLLTGSVTDQKYADDAVKIAWAVRGVKEVLNEIETSPKDIKDYTKDTLIANTVRSKLLFEKDLRSVNYSVDVNNGAVYLIGVAQNQAELDKALKITSSAKGVKRVVNYVILKDDPRRLRDGMLKKKEM